MIRKTIYIAIAFPFLVAQAQPGERDTLNFVSLIEQSVLLNSEISPDSLVLLMVYDPSFDLDQYHNIESTIKAHSDFLSSVRCTFKTDEGFLKFVFKDTHQKFLQQYVKYSEFNNLFYKGSYNCISGAALYGQILKQLGFQARIVETRYHSFTTIVVSGEEEYLIESTDPKRGFISGKKRVAEKISEYHKKESANNIDTVAVPSNKFPALRYITIKQLAALHYFNLAVVNFKINFDQALCYLRKAECFYPQSQRIKELLDFTLKRRPQSNVAYLSSENQIKQIQNIK